LDGIHTRYSKNRRILSFLCLTAVLAAAHTLVVPRRAEATPPPPFVTMSFVGDVLLDSWPISFVYDRIRAKQGWDGVYAYPFKKIKPSLEGVVFCNCEGPLTNQKPKPFADKDERSYFSVNPRFAKSLKQAGFDVVSLSNNHIKDCGTEGVLESVRSVASVRIEPVGAGANNQEARRPAFLERDGLKIAFLSYDLVNPKSVWADAQTPGAAHADAAGVSTDVTAARKNADIVVVNFHWGIEYRSDWDHPPPDASRVKIAHAAIDAGAQLVVGEHSHTVEKIEIYKHGLIAYGLGNFMFGAATREGHPESMILKARVNPQGLISYQVVPVLISPHKTRYQTVPLDGEAKAVFIRKLEKLSGLKNIGDSTLQPAASVPSTVTPMAVTITKTRSGI